MSLPARLRVGEAAACLSVTYCYCTRPWRGVHLAWSRMWGATFRSNKNNSSEQLISLSLATLSILSCLNLLKTYMSGGVESHLLPYA